METVTMLDESHSKTEKLHLVATTNNTKTDKSENYLHANILAKSELDEYLSNETTSSFENISYATKNEIILEKIPKIETDEQNLGSESESNDEPDEDPFADVKCDPNFVLSGNPQIYQTVQQQEPEKSTKTNLTIKGHSPTPSKHSLPTPTPSTTIVQKNSQFKFNCKLCFTNLGSENDLKSHLSLCSTTHKNRRLFCIDCNIKYACKKGIKNHNLKVHRRGIKPIRPDHYRVQLKCQFCPSMFVLREKFRTHTESHLKNLELHTATIAQNDAKLQLKLNPYKCQECDSTFSTVMNLSDHVLAKHVDHIFKCPHEKCGKIFGTKGKLNRHFNIHSDYRPFQCPQPNCGKRFKRKETMSRHVASHSDIKLFKCSEPNCGNTVRTESDLEKHMKELHKSGDNNRPAINKPFACPECPMTFSQNWRVTAHVNLVHRKGEPLKCPHEDCGKTFKYENNLNVHVKEKHGSRDKEESFKCPHLGCNFVSKRKNYIKVHMKTHTGERPFKCGVVEGCSKSFMKFSDLKTHIREKHNEDVQ